MLLRGGRVAALLLCLAVSALGSGCYNNKEHVRSVYLVDHSALTPMQGDRSLLYYEKPDVKWKKYKKVLLDPITVYYAEEAKNRQIQPDDLKRITDYFKNAILKALKNAYPVVANPGSDVLCIRVAITEVEPVSQELIPVTPSSTFIPLNMARTSIEAEFLDSLSMERLAALVEKKDDSQVDIMGGFTRWGYAKTTFDEWARDLRKSLDAVHGRRMAGKPDEENRQGQQTPQMDKKKAVDKIRQSERNKTGDKSRQPERSQPPGRTQTIKEY